MNSRITKIALLCFFLMAILFLGKKTTHQTVPDESRPASMLQTPAKEIEKTEVPSQNLIPFSQKTLTPKEKWVEAVSLGKKVLYSADDQKRLHAAWADPQLLFLARQRLMEMDTESTSSQAIAERMEAIDYLDGAALWAKNPRRSEALAIMEDFLSRDLSVPDYPLPLRRLLAGDAIELYGVLLQADESRARELYARSSPVQRSLFDFGKKMLERPELHSANLKEKNS